MTALNFSDYIKIFIGIIAIINSVISGLMFSSGLGVGFTISSMIGLIYPLLTLILLNTTFKDDLTN